MMFSQIPTTVAIAVITPRLSQSACLTTRAIAFAAGRLAGREVARIALVSKDAERA
jgi:hypothetical protein